MTEPEVILGALLDISRGGGRNAVSSVHDGVYVSYLPTSSLGEETALVLASPPKGGNFWNLFGDHQKEYVEAYARGGIPAMIAYYEANQDQASPYTEYSF